MIVLTHVERFPFHARVSLLFQFMRIPAKKYAYLEEF
jgi:hypothetical protein